MRAVDYVTNGFGGSLPILNSTQQESIQPYVESAVAGYGVPLSVIKAAVRTYYQFGLSGFRRTLAFVDAINQAEEAFVRIYPNVKSQLSGPNAGAVYKRGIKSMLNTAASRIGLTPLSSAILDGVNQWLDSIPNSSTDPRTFPMRLWIQSMRTWVGRLSSGVQ